MAFSQKHTGKVFVPWFNTAEWQYVCNLVNSNLEEERRKALDILRIWKLRTPLLSAGIAGTLILLETLLTNKKDLTEFQIIQIYSVSLQRFLNICAANNDKQGTFNKTVTKNDIPKWIIDIRHDIAHSNRLPSKVMLELALTHSFRWVIEKYWNIQNDTVSDYFVNTESNNTKIVDTLKAYIGLSFNIHMNNDMKEYEENLMKKVNYLVSKRYNKPKTNKQGLLDVLEEILKQLLSNSENTNMPSIVAEVLVNAKGLLGTHLETNSEGVEIIPDKFLFVWSRLLNILHENECLTALLEKLFSVAIDTVNALTKQIAVTWLHNILDGLLKIYLMKNKIGHSYENEANENCLDLRTSGIVKKGILERKTELKNFVDFASFEKLPVKGLSTLENKIINGPIPSDTKQLLEKVMLLNNRSKDEIIAFTNLIKTLETPDIYSMNFDTILTIEDIPMDEKLLQILEFNQETTDGLSALRNGNKHQQEKHISSGMSWEIEKDTSIFKDCPLGIISIQSRTENPLIMFH